MWFLFGNKTRVKRVKNGRVLDDRCPECGELARLVECEVQETTTLYAVVTVDDERATAFRCTQCGELFDLVDLGESDTLRRFARAGLAPLVDAVRELP